MLDIGFSIDQPRQARTGTATPVPAPPPPPAPPAPPVQSNAFLPALTTAGASYHGVGSNERLIESYAGPLAAVTNAPGTQGIQSLGDGALGLKPSDLPQPVTCLYGWFDQSGKGRNFVQDTLANRPRLRAEVTIGGKLALAFGGHKGAGEQVALPYAVSLAATNRTEFWVVDSSVSIQTAVLAEHAAAGDAALRRTMTAPDFAGHLRAAGGESGVVLPAQPCVVIVVDGPTGGAIYIDGVRRAVPAGTAGTIVSTTLGWSPSLGVPSIANMRLAAYGAIDAAISDAEALAVHQALSLRFGVNGGFAVNLLHIGDSIVEGVSATDTLGLKAMVVPGLARRTRYTSLGIAGKSLAACYADRAIYDAALLQPGMVNVALIDAGINDLCFGAEGVTLYGQVATPYVAALKAMGYRVALATVLPQASTRYGVPVSADVVEGRRQAFNTAVRNNAAGADVIVDRAAVTEMGRYPESPNDLALYPDALHPTTAGYALLAPTYRAAIDAVSAGG